MTLTFGRDDRGRPLLRVVGEIDLATAPRLRLALERLVRTADGAAVIDMSAVGFMDCQGVTVLLEAVERARVAGLGLCAVASPAGARLIRLTGLSAVLNFYERLDDIQTAPEPSRRRPDPPFDG